MKRKKEVGSKVIDKTFPQPIGRIRKRTGLVTKDQLDRLKTCLQELWSQGRTEELVLYRDGKIDSSRIIRLVELRETIDPNEEFLNSPLFPTLEGWMERWYLNPRTKNDVPPDAVPLPMLDLQPSAVLGVEAYPGTRAMA